MDLSFTDEQIAVRDLARQIFDGRCTDERLRQIEAGEERFDPTLWSELGRAGLLGIGIDDADGGSGGGMLELCLLLEAAGRAAAPVPLWASQVTGAMPVSRFGSFEQRAMLLRPLASGGAPVVAALTDPSVVLEHGRLRGRLGLVPSATQAGKVLVPFEDGLLVIDARGQGITRARQHARGGYPIGEMRLDGVVVEGRIAAPLPLVYEHAIVGLCALQVGVAGRAIEMTAAYLSQREQFGRPLGSFQAVQQRAADAYIDLEAMRWTMWRAAWLLSEGRPAAEEVAVAKFWCSEGGARILAAAQHLHGGMGVDMDYPLHRYTFLARQIELALGGAAEHLARLGELIAR